MDDHSEGVDELRKRFCVRISRRWTLVAAAAVALVVGATGLASSTAPPGEARALGEIFFNKNMARAEVVMVLRGSVHDFRIDQGRVVAVRPTAVELLERDGTRAVIPVAATAQVLLNGQLVPLQALPRGVNAVTIRDGEQPAQTVRATGRRQGKKP